MSVRSGPTLEASFESHPIATGWDRALTARYVRFAHVLAGPHELEITIGRGGLSFYANSAGRRAFVCHFNAAPRAGRDDLGFADFKPHALAPQLDPEAVIRDMKRRLAPTIELRAGKAWYGAHFDREQDSDVADAFRLSILDVLLAP